MSWIETFSLVMRSNVTALIEKVENPERVLNQLIIDMEEEHERVRQSVAAAIADEIVARKRSQQAREEAEAWMERAAAALRRGDETSSRAALEQKQLCVERADGLQAEYERQREQTAELQRAVGELDDKIRQAKQRQTLLLAKLARAESSQRINEAMRRVDGGSAFAHFARMEQRVERACALDEAYKRLDGDLVDTEALARKLAKDKRKEDVERELAELRRRVSGEGV